MKKILSTLILLTAAMIGAKAQQGAVSAGGEASGPGGSVSYSIGQTDYITKSSSGHFISDGLQQPYEISIALPIRLLSFKASISNGQSHLTWITSSEYNNHHFEIQRSPDGAGFSKLDIVNSKGNSATNQHYDYTDPAPFNGITWYRLKQVDIDNKSTLSNVVSVRLNNNGNSSLQLFPNPATAAFTITIQADREKDYTLLLVNTIGIVVETKKVHCNKGDNTLYWNIDQLPAGIYILKTINNETPNIKIIKQ
jgi:hypothetical protein